MDDVTVVTITIGGVQVYSANSNRRLQQDHIHRLLAAGDAVFDYETKLTTTKTFVKVTDTSEISFFVVLFALISVYSL